MKRYMRGLWLALHGRSISKAVAQERIRQLGLAQRAVLEWSKNGQARAYSAGVRDALLWIMSEDARPPFGGRKGKP